VGIRDSCIYRCNGNEDGGIREWEWESLHGDGRELMGIGNRGKNVSSGTLNPTKTTNVAKYPHSTTVSVMRRDTTSVWTKQTVSQAL